MSITSTALYLGKTVIIEGIHLTSEGIRILLKANPYLHDLTSRLDLYAQLEVLDAIVSSVSNSKASVSKAVEISLEKMKDALDDVHNMIKFISDLIKEHNELWLSSWRHATYSEYLPKLEDLWHILQQRCDTFMKTIQFTAYADMLSRK